MDSLESLESTQMATYEIAGMMILTKRTYDVRRSNDNSNPDIAIVKF